MKDFFFSIGNGAWNLIVENKKEVFLILFTLVAGGLWAAVTGGFKKIGSWLWKVISTRKWKPEKKEPRAIQELRKTMKDFMTQNPPVKRVIPGGSDSVGSDGGSEVAAHLDKFNNERAEGHKRWQKSHKTYLENQSKALIKDESGIIMEVLGYPIPLVEPEIRLRLWLREKRQKRIKYELGWLYKAQNGMILKMVGTQEEYFIAIVFARGGSIALGTYSLYRQGSKYSHTFQSDDWKIVSEVRE